MGAGAAQTASRDLSRSHDLLTLLSDEQMRMLAHRLLQAAAVAERLITEHKPAAARLELTSALNLAETPQLY